MWVTKARYQELERACKEESDRNRHQLMNKGGDLAMERAYRSLDKMEIRHHKMALNAAESALKYKEDVIEELQAEVYELTCGLSDSKINFENQVDLATDYMNQYLHADKKLDAALDAQRKAEAALEAATRISYVVALHINDVPAVPRYSSLDTAYAEYMNATKPNLKEREAGIHSHYPYRIFALRGDAVIADVTDPSKWDETLPVSSEREQGPRWVHPLRDRVIGDIDISNGRLNPLLFP